MTSCIDSVRDAYSDGGSTICAFTGVTHRVDPSNNNDYMGSWKSYKVTSDYVSRVGISILEMWSSPSDTAGDSCYLRVFDEDCDSCTFTDCNAGEDETDASTSSHLGFVADCSNIWA